MERGCDMSNLIWVPPPAEPKETALPLQVMPGTPFARVLSPKGIIGTINTTRDDDAALRKCSEKRCITILPNFKLVMAPPVIMVSRKPPFERDAQRGQYVRESHDPGVYCDFYANSRGRFMRVNDAYRHVTYQLQRAYWVQIPPDLPRDMLDLDLGWFPE